MMLRTLIPVFEAAVGTNIGGMASLGLASLRPLGAVTNSGQPSCSSSSSSNVVSVLCRRLSFNARRVPPALHATEGDVPAVPVRSPQPSSVGTTELPAQKPSNKSATRSSSKKGNKTEKKALQRENDALNHLPTEPNSLRFVPGIGAAFEQRLQKKNINTFLDLKLKYEEVQKNSMAFKEFLKGVGINRQNHLSSIIAFFETMDQEPKDPQVTLSIEGNIGAGKSTFLSILNKHVEDRTAYNFIKEPVEKWQNVGGMDGDQKVNLLELFYQDPERMAYTFQNYVFLTRVMQERETYNSTRLARLLERSIFSDRMVFVRAVHAARHLKEHELQIYDSWFGPILKALPTLIPNGFIYMKTQPTTCLKRLQKRNRSEEVGISLEYLENLHERHQDWLEGAGTLATAFKHLDSRSRQQEEQQRMMAQQQGQQQASGQDRAPGGIVSLERQPPLGLDTLSIPSSLEDSLLFIDASKVAVPGAEFLHQMPALKLEYDADVDVENDLDFGRAMAKKVEDYTAFVVKYRTARTAALKAASEQGASTGYNQTPSGLYLPGSNEYWRRSNGGHVSYNSQAQSEVAAMQQACLADVEAKVEGGKVHQQRAVRKQEALATH